MNKVICIIILLALMGCAVQQESAMRPESSLCTNEQIKDLLSELGIQINEFEYLTGDCTGWGNSKKVELNVNGIRYSLAATHRSAPNSEGSQFCFTTEKENDPLFIDARNQICEKIKKSGFDQEYINCKQGEYDNLEKGRINLKFGSTRSGQYFSQLNEDCMLALLPQ